MTTVQFTVAEIKLPPAGKERGNVITTDGRKYGLFREKASLLQLNCTYEAEVTDGQYCNIMSVKLLSAASPQQQPAAASAPSANGHSNGNGYYRPTSPEDAERMLVTSWGNAFIRAGQIEPNEEQIVKMIAVLRRAYAKTFDFDSQVFTASQAGRHHMTATQ
jgi:hypothetical protein